MERRKRVLVAPLDWGLGHATRCIPIIDELLKQDAEVFVGAYGDGLLLLKEAYPQLTFVDLPGVKIRYQKNGSFALNLFFQLPKLLRSIKRENIQLSKLIDEYLIDIVISDNRFGLYSREVKTVFITHQLRIIMPQVFKLFQPLVDWLNYKYINRFNVCWIPDAEGVENLGGKMSHPILKPTTPLMYLGAITRMHRKHSEEKKWTAIAVLSGPEPQRTLFEEKLIRQMQTCEGKFLIVRGKADYKSSTVINNVSLINYLNSTELEREIGVAEVLICRSGYSTLMDLTALQIPAIMVPTPGQTEQEYLAESLTQKKIYFSSGQAKFQLLTALQLYSKFTNKLNNYESNLQTAVKKLLQQ